MIKKDLINTKDYNNNNFFKAINSIFFYKKYKKNF